MLWYPMTTNTKMAAEGCFALSVFGLLNDVTFHMAKCCAEVRKSRARLDNDKFSGNTKTRF